MVLLLFFVVELCRFVLLLGLPEEILGGHLHFSPQIGDLFFILHIESCHFNFEILDSSLLLGNLDFKDLSQLIIVQQGSIELVLC